MTDTPAPTKNARRYLRIYYLLRFAALASIIPYLNLFLRRRDLSGRQIGALVAVAAIAALVAAPLWGRLSDRLGRPLRLVQVALLCSMIAYFLMSRQSSFGWIAVFIALQALGNAAVAPLSDSFAVELGRHAGFGGMRLWGSFGWAVMVLVAGWLIERRGISVIFTGYAVLALLAVLALSLVSRSVPAPLHADSVLPPVDVMVKSLFADRRMLGLMATMLIWEMSIMSVEQFEPIFLDQLGAGETLIGLVFTLAALVEMPGMLLADRLLKNRDAAWLLRAACWFGAARAALILIAPTVGAITSGGSVLRGFLYAFKIVGLTVFVTRHAPKNQVATVLAVYTVVLYNVSNMLAGLTAGWIFDKVGAYWLYALALAGSLAAWLLLEVSILRPAMRLAKE
jgi:PPP family 3-phenylpropionic acid transporter